MNLINVTRATTVGTRISIADTSLYRLIGLAGRRRLDSGCGLLIRPSSGIHTFGMLFAIDVVALSRDLRVLKLWHRLAPFRVTSINLSTHSMLELPAGQISHCQMKVGDQLEFVQELEEFSTAVSADEAGWVTKKGTGSGPSYEPPPEQLQELQR